MSGPVRHLLTLADLSSQDVAAIARRGADLASATVPADPTLAGRVIGIYFRHVSTRTRTSFSSAALRLGAQIVAYGPQDLQRATGESARDTGMVLGGMLDAFVARTAGPEEELRDYACQDDMAVINAMSAREHPTQALADLSTMLRHFGALEGISVRYVGEGNNTAAALALALAHVPGSRFVLNTPAGYGLDPDIAAASVRIGQPHDATLEETHAMTPLGDAQVVYTTQWETTGTDKPDPDWRRIFEPFQVDSEVMAGEPDAVFMHDLPARRGDEVTADVLDGPDSIAMSQAHMKARSAMAVLEHCVNSSVHVGRTR